LNSGDYGNCPVFGRRGEKNLIEEKIGTGLGTGERGENGGKWISVAKITVGFDGIGIGTR